MSNIRNSAQQFAVAPWGSEEAKRKESHVARYLEREYVSLEREKLSILDIGIDPDVGPMFDQTEELMEVHYDQELEFFRGFLDEKYMAYTMAYFGYDDDKFSEDEQELSIEDAQEKKFRLICERAGITGNERILNIGCGFGALEKYLLENYPNIEVVGVTPSRVQAKYIKECMIDSDHVFDEQRFKVIQKSFECVSNDDIGSGVFDIVMSIGLIEAIRNLKIFHGRVVELLKPGGKVFHHLIVSRIAIPQFLDSRESLIGKYFPGGRVWPFYEIENHVCSLELETKWFVNGMNYWKTLDEWHKKFWENIDNLKKKNPSLDVGYWNDYFILCKACFLPKNGTIFGNGHYLFRKPI